MQYNYKCRIVFAVLISSERRLEDISLLVHECVIEWTAKCSDVFLQFTLGEVQWTEYFYVVL